MEPEQSKMNTKIIVAVVAVVLLLIGATSFVLVQNKKTQEQPTPAAQQEQEEEKAVPTVDTNVEVSLEYTANGKDVLLKVEGIPEGTKSIEYELSYETKEQGLQGILPSEPVIIKKGETEWEKELKFATCSSGTCVYQQVVGPVKVSLKFNGSYGDKLFEKEFEL